MAGVLSDLVLLPDVDILKKIPVKENKGLVQELEELHVKSFCQKNGRPIWRPKVAQTTKEQNSTVDSYLQHLELQSNCISSRVEDETELEDEDGADCHYYSDSDLSDCDVSLLPEATQAPGMGVELFSEKEDWDKELNESCPYDEDDLEISVRRGCCEVQLVWQDGENYNPSHDHAPSLRANIVEIPIVQGQFDDADE
ncbi:coordinator of PRMT5 and differentiation stimulator-like [Heterodontus francisci]|uniref:coordinator of PRMT5 and differentiation stimulator-like n=1 Tax=Heterodontus francisci TaxID=7792 RepID=UPI00355C56D9